MSEDELDPGANTEMFQAFMDRPEPEATGRPWMGVAVAAAIGLVVLVLLAWLVLGG